MKWQGVVSFKVPGTTGLADVDFHYRRDESQEEPVGVLVMSGSDGRANVQPFTYHPDISSQAVIRIYPVYFGELGELLCSEWEWGSAVQLVVFRLNADHTIDIVFNGRSRFGYQILNVTGGKNDDICEGNGYMKGPYWMKVYTWDGGKFVLGKTVAVEEPQRYSIDAK
ncbi:MAG TPA: hypothetical protein VH253_00790 [Phycisphaerae bacterium]|nr:hypothetical protein [Phycisphaerae bacterium]HVZ80667.1 hypothetical protein [bacterium]